MNAELHAFFYEQVFMVYDEYRKIKNNNEIGLQRDKQAAINACLALYHLREHLPFSINVDELTDKCNDYKLVRDVANIYKHNTILRYTPKVRKIQEILVVSYFSDEFGVYSNEEKVVEIELDDGSKRNLFEIMTNVINMWFEILADRGVNEPREQIKKCTQKFVSRTDAQKVKLLVVQGLRFEQKMRFQYYDKNSDSFKPLEIRP